MGFRHEANDTPLRGECVPARKCCSHALIKQALFLLGEGKGVLLFIFHIKYFQSSH